MSKILPFLIALGGLPDFKEVEKREDKCGLPGCENMTDRGYCCAEHCKKHKAMVREARHGRKP